MTTRLLGSFLALLLSASLPSAEPTAAPVFADGDVVALVGDSITHNGKWHGYVATYYATRFPGRDIRFLNAGISGDTASGALNRLDEDVLAHHPNVAVVMLGMNDVGRNDYKVGADAATIAKRGTSFTNYAKNLTTLTQRLTAGGVKRVVMVTPSPYDDTAVLERENLPGVNAALGSCATIVRDLAGGLKGGVVDFHASMTELNQRLQSTKPSFTLIGSDRVHPGPDGHLIMAWRFLKDQGAPARVSRIVLDAAAKSGQAEGARLEELDWIGSVASVTVTEEALPWPLDPAAAAAPTWAPIIDDLNRQEFIVKGLSPGTYHLTIDGTAVGGWSADELAQGVNLALCPTAPQVRQAERVRELCVERTTLMARLRSIALVELRWLKGKGIDLKDPAAVEAALADRLAKATPATGNPRPTIELYRELKPKEAQAWAEVEDLTKRIREAAQPKPHLYLLRHGTN